jgi:NCAIR mutase (PurE)-related protein
MSDLETLLRRLAHGELPVEDVLCRLHGAGIANVGEAQVDLDRGRRCGFPEVVYAQGKTVPAMQRIFEALLEHGQEVLATRLAAEPAAELLALFPKAVYNPIGRTFRISPARTPVVGPDGEDVLSRGKVTVVTAGTSDLPVAEEARETALWTGVVCNMIQDVGVAGPHRLRANLPALEGADAVVVVAGMEGALPSVVGGYVPCPIIAVPTSVGYGAAFGGVAALLGMLNSCASNVTVVNIDAGFKAGYVAGLIARNAARARGAG